MKEIFLSHNWLGGWFCKPCAEVSVCSDFLSEAERMMIYPIHPVHP